MSVTYTISPTAKPYCHGDTLQFTINNNGLVSKYYWNFGDGISKEADSLITSYYVYTTPGKYLLRFKSLVDDLPVGSCNNDLLDTVRIGAKPVADFVVQNNYENEQADFSSLTVLKKPNLMLDNGLKDEIDLWYWNFGTTTTSSTTDSLADNTFPYYKGKPYIVTHAVRSAWGCTDTTRQAIPIFPRIDFSLGNYFEDFNTNDSTGFYQSGDYNKGGNASWKYQPPSGDSLLISSSPAWITDNNKTDTAYNFEEFSWVESPAFLLYNLDLPVLSLDTWSLTEHQLDGACLQWALADTTFGNEQWHTIGAKDEGVNWYNSNIVVGMLNKVEKSGIHTPGWTGRTAEEWQTSRFSLDAVKTQAGTRPVRFRVLFVSNADNAPGQYDGFAFDNFFVANRNRKVLVEEFCDYAHNEVEFTDSAYIHNSQMIRMQYHNRYMLLDDEINNQNKGETGARILLYGYSTLPRAAVDGSYSLDYTEGFFGGPTKIGVGQRSFDKRLLEPSPFTININIPTLPATGNALNFNVDFTRDDILTEQGPFVLQVAVLEKEVSGNGTTFTNVFRKFLPDAAGKHVDKNNWPAATTIPVERSFTPFQPLTVRNDGDTSLILVAFIQDEATSEVYQSESKVVLYGDVKNLSTVPLPAKLDGSTLNISLYPNPAQSSVAVRFGSPAAEVYEYRLIDGFGRMVANGSIAKDSTMATISGLQDLPVGLYQLQLTGASEAVTRSLSIVR